MNKLYLYATLLLTSITLSYGAFAQTYSGGTYTAVRNRDWHVASGVNAWDPSGEPPAQCINCKIIINSGVTVRLNASVTLSGSSILQIGTDGSAATALVIPHSGGADFASSYNVILVNDGSSPDNKMELNSNIDIVNASAADGHDGVLTSYVSGGNTTYFKKLGLAPAGFYNNMAVDGGTPAAQSYTGTKTLNGVGTLPILLTDLTATLVNDQVELTWRTQLEVNSDHFTIQRSTDNGASWTELGTVAARGNSSTIVDYTFTDAKAAAGVAQYRLIMVDLDRKFAYSPIKIVRNGLVTGISIFPNPAKDFVNVSIAGKETGALSIRLLNQAGQVLVEKKVTNAGGTTIPVAVSTYPTGNYLIVVKGADGAQQVSKLFISK